MEILINRNMDECFLFCKHTKLDSKPPQQAIITKQL